MRQKACYCLSVSKEFNCPRELLNNLRAISVGAQQSNKMTILGNFGEYSYELGMDMATVLTKIHEDVEQFNQGKKQSQADKDELKIMVALNAIPNYGMCDKAYSWNTLKALLLNEENRQLKLKKKKKQTALANQADENRGGGNGSGSKKKECYHCKSTKHKTGDKKCPKRAEYLAYKLRESKLKNIKPKRIKPTRITKETQVAAKKQKSS